MTPPDLTSMRTSTANLLHWLDALAWTDIDIRAASALPDWTRAHVLTHIARNADAISRTLAGALRGENVPRYPDYPAGRNADIEAGAGRSVTELVADVRESADRLDRVFDAFDDADPGVWDRIADDRPAAKYPYFRWREVEIHRVDLAAGYTPDEWPASLVARLLPELADGLAARSGGQAFRIEVATAGSVTQLAGREWCVGDPSVALDVVGPDWALVAWLSGRAWAAAAALSSAPPLPAWI